MYNERAFENIINRHIISHKTSPPPPTLENSLAKYYFCAAAANITHIHTGPLMGRFKEGPARKLATRGHICSLSRKSRERESCVFAF